MCTYFFNNLERSQSRGREHGSYLRASMLLSRGMYFEVTGAARVPFLDLALTDTEHCPRRRTRALLGSARTSPHYTCAILHRRADFGRGVASDALVADAGRTLVLGLYNCLFVRIRLFRDFCTCKFALFRVRSLKWRHVFAGLMTLHCATCDGAYIFFWISYVNIRQAFFGGIL
jgi:hypothetical protein